MKKATSTKKATTKSKTAKKKTAKEASTTGKIDHYYLPSPRDKKFLDISQDFLLRLCAIPTVSKIASMEIMSLLLVMARYPKQTRIPKKDITITIKVPCLFADRKAKYVWEFMHRDRYLSVSCAVSFDESAYLVKLFTWYAWAGIKSKFDYNRNVVFKDFDPKYEKSIWEYLLEYEIGNNRMDFGVKHKGYYSHHEFWVK